MQPLRCAAVVMVVLTATGCLPIYHEPRFTSFSDKLPPAREHCPPTVPWGTASGTEVSGFDLMFAFEGTLPAGSRFVQRLVITGVRDIGCTGNFLPYSFVRLEYFEHAFDLQSWLGDAEQRRFENRRGWAAVLLLPGAPPGVPPGENAALLTDAYLASIGPLTVAELSQDVVEDAVAQWRIDYEYDGCHPSDRSPVCRTPHCLTLWYRTRDDPAEDLGDWDSSSWAEEGSQW